MSGEYDRGANRGAGSPLDRKAKGKNSGSFDFNGQPARDETPGTDTQEEAAARSHVNCQKQHNVHNGAGVSKKIIHSDSHELHGGRRTTDTEGGLP